MTNLALKDMIQNHLLELLSLIAMNDPKENSPDSIRDEKVNVLKIIKNVDYNNNVVRVQYIKSK